MLFVMLQAGSSEEKQLHNLYKVLGTPRTEGFTDFFSLPRAAELGHKLKVRVDVINVKKLSTFLIMS